MHPVVYEVVGYRIVCIQEVCDEIIGYENIELTETEMNFKLTVIDDDNVDIALSVPPIYKSIDCEKVIEMDMNQTSVIEVNPCEYFLLFFTMCIP